MIEHLYTLALSNIFIKWAKLFLLNIIATARISLFSEYIIYRSS